MSQPDSYVPGEAMQSWLNLGQKEPEPPPETSPPPEKTLEVARESVETKHAEDDD